MVENTNNYMIQQEQIILSLQKKTFQTDQIKFSSQTNLPNQTYQTKPTKSNLPNKTCQTKPTQQNLPTQTYPIKPAQLNLPNQTHQT